MNRRFSTYSLAILIYTLLSVAWGVFVRASGSGDGCGTNWPLCDGEHIPLNGMFAKFVESSHRLTTSVIGVFALVLVYWAFQSFPKGSVVRKASVVTLGLTIFEGLIGFLLVKYQLVVHNDSALRAGVMGLHVVSTFFLLGAMALAWLGSKHELEIRLRGQGSVGWMLAMAFAGVCFLGVSGAISALGHQLQPTKDVIAAAMNPATFWMVRLQPLHPIIAVSVGVYLVLVAGMVCHLRPDPRVRVAAGWMVGLYFAQSLVGVVNILTNAPIALQMIHLVWADINFITVVALSAYALQAGVERVELRPPPETAPAAEPLRGRALVNAYIALTKPRIISLLLFTTLTAMIAAQKGFPPLWQFLAVAIGGYMSAGAANAINMVIDRDIDLTMKRTATRPTVTQSISSPHVLTFAFTLTLLSFIILWVAGGPLSAVLSFSGLVFYVVIYTMLLKRRTWQNIVIGGAAGAFPPLVGWAAVTNDIPPLALYLFAIVFVWTPVHFWALALLLKDEYAAAGVPMLPVVKGDRVTVNQILIYAVITVIVTMIPFLMPQVGYIYGGAALVLNALLIKKCFDLSKQIDRPHASSLFHYSMLYLALLFLSFAVSRSVTF